MVGKIILCILGVLLLLLIIVLLIPARVRASYDQGTPLLWAQFGPIKIQLFPVAEKKQKPKKKGKKAKNAKKAAEDEGAPAASPAEKEKTEESSPKKKKFDINSDQIFYSLETLPPILGRALKRVGRRIRICPLKIHLLVAGSDPADTAQLFGRLEAALSAALPLLHQIVRIEDQDIQLFPDFVGEQMDCIADMGVSIRPWDLLSVGIRAGGSLLKWFWGFKKLATPPSAQKDKEAA